MDRFMIFLLFGQLLQLGKTSQTNSFDIVTIIQNRFAETTITSEVLNDKDVADEIGFHIMLPKEAFMTYFAMTINGTTYEGKIEEKLKAVKVFERAKAKGKTVGLVKTAEHSNKVFKTSVNIGAGTSVVFKLIYQQLLRKIRGKYINNIILFEPPEHLSLNVYICEPRRILNVNTPDILTHEGKLVAPIVDVELMGNSAHVTFLTRLNEDILSKTRTVGGSFIVEYELEETEGAGDIVVNNGYFLHFFAPDVKVPPRRIVFVLDTSFSMSGQKLQQQTKAMLNIVERLTETDRFGILKFHDSVIPWSDALLPGTKMNLEEAKNFISHSHRLGGTYIWRALKEALLLLGADVEGGEEVVAKNNFIVLMTDGQGQYKKDKMLKSIDALNKGRFAIHTMGFGLAVDADLLKAVAAANHGSWKQIIVSLESALQIQNYMDELGITLMSGVEIEYPEVIGEIVRPHTKAFAGGEVLAVGRFKDDIDPSNFGPHYVSLKGFAAKNATLQSDFFINQKDKSDCKALKESKVKDFGLKAFGMLKVEEALRSYDVELNETMKEQLKQKAIQMSLLYKLVTPVTAMLVIKPEDLTEIEKEEELPKTTTTALPLLTRPLGAQAAAPRFFGRGDPHFLVRLLDDVDICFSWTGKIGDIVNFVNDIDKSITINGLLRGYNEDDKKNKTHHLFIKKLAIILQKEKLEITIDGEKAVVRNHNFAKNKTYELQLTKVESYSVTHGELTFIIEVMDPNISELTIKIREEIKIAVKVHQTLSRSGVYLPHLDFGIPKLVGFSSNIGGFFGRFSGIKMVTKGLAKYEDIELRRIHSRHHKVLPGKDNTITTDESTSENDGKVFPRYIPGHSVLFNNGRVLTKHRKFAYHEADYECWWIEDLDSFLGISQDYFDVKSLLEVPAAIE